MAASPTLILHYPVACPHSTFAPLGCLHRNSLTIRTLRHHQLLQHRHRATGGGDFRVGRGATHGLTVASCLSGEGGHADGGNRYRKGSLLRHCASLFMPELMKRPFFFSEDTFPADGWLWSMFVKVCIWIRSMAIAGAFVLVFGVRSAVAGQNSVQFRPLPVFAHVSSVADKSNASTVREHKETRQTTTTISRTSVLNRHDEFASTSLEGNDTPNLASRNSGPNKRVEGASKLSEGNSKSSEEFDTNKCSNGEAVTGSLRIEDPSSSQTSPSTNNSSHLRRWDAEENEDQDLDTEEEYEEEDDEFEDIDDAFLGVNINEGTSQATPDISEPKASLNAPQPREDGTRRVVSGPKAEEDKELRQAFEEWKSKPYKLTVPLRVVGLRGSIPPIWIKDFMRSQGRRARTTVEYQGSLKEILTELAISLEKKQIKSRSIMAADLVTVGDSWLRIAVAGGLIEPIKNAEQYHWFQSLTPRWQALLRRDGDGRLDPGGRLWAVPYRWGSMVIAFKKDKLAKNNVPPIKDWADLWRPELTGKIAMVDSPREVIGAVLRALGASYNTEDFEKEVPGGKEAVKNKFLAFQKQVRLFDSMQYLKALGAGDVWVAVGWSSDVIPVAKRMSHMAVVAPESGTSLWADLWAIPAARYIQSDKIGGRIRGPSPLIHQWFDFCLQPARALPFHQGVFVGASPLFLPQKVESLDTASIRAPKIAVGGSEACAKVSGNLPVLDPLENDTIGQAVDLFDENDVPNFDTNLVKGMAPKEILAKSEFLEPLSDKAVSNYEWLLSQGAEVRGWPSGIWELIKGFFQGSLRLTQSVGLRH